MPSPKGNTKTQAPASRRIITVENVGGIRHFVAELAAGVNVLTGQNGAGKTSTMNAVARLYGAEIPLEPRDGTDHGTVEDDRGVRLVIKKVAKVTGVADVALAETGALADLIDGGGHKDPDARARSRIRALLRLTRLPVTDEAIATLAGDPEVAALALREIRDNQIDDLLAAAEKVRLAGHKLARESESGAEVANGRALAHDLHADEALRKVGGLDRLTDLPLADAEAQERDLGRRFEISRVSAKQRQELEAQQAEVRASLGTKPDPSRYDEDLAIRRDAIAANEARVAEVQDLLRGLERKLAQEKEALAGVREDVRHLEQQRSAEEERLRKWARQAEILDRPVTGSTPAEVEKVGHALEAARDRTERARHSEDYERNRAASAEAVQEATDKAKRAEILRALATGVQERLGALLAGTDAQGLTVEGGRLAVVENGETLDFETRRSDGQRIRIALRIAARSYRGQVVPLDGRYWTQLDGNAQAEFAQIAAELGLSVITEQPTNGELAIAHVATEQPEEPAA